ncbi:MAG TPA: hypothetical protein VNE38_03360 [Ktedonobacteraceae bacterium]|nr:hypothetical protein [Ktedonobacteraceae bacterium]
MDQENQLEIIPDKQLQRSKLPPLPHWPTSKRGPLVTEPPPGTRRMRLRSEQVVEINYDQERGRSRPEL